MIYEAHLLYQHPGPKILMLDHHLQHKVLHDSTHMSPLRCWKKSPKALETEWRIGMAWISIG
jgi:hypothetical protein